MDELTITRDIDLDLTAEELWRLVGDGDAWSEWLVDSSDVPVEPGGEGDVLDDGERRHVRIDRVDAGRSVQYTWWPDDEGRVASTVELVIVPRPDGSTLRVREVLQASATASKSAMRWELRAFALWRAALLVPVRR